jgi:diguanylate cyclase (GGDEF)-like protein
MKKLTSVDDFKRLLYLSLIPIISLTLIIYIVENPTPPKNDMLNYVIIRVLLIWYMVSWILVYKRLFQRFFEIVYLVVITVVHIATVYDVIFNHLAVGKAGAIDTSIVWVPLIIITYFIILNAKWGLVYSLVVFTILLTFAIINLPSISTENSLKLIQFYAAYIVYILLFYFSIYLFKLFAELEMAKKHATTDSLTGIANRYQIDLWIEDLPSRLKDNHPYSILFFDVDYFKRVNDQFGHKVGDSVLKELTNLVKTKLTNDELFGRWGGEEFVIITQSSGEIANEKEEELRKSIEEYGFHLAGRQTASFGVTEIRPDEMSDSFIGRADKGLYESKNNGRNRVTMV